MESVCNGYGPLHIDCPVLELHWGLSRLLPRLPFSSHDIRPQSPLLPTLRRYFLGFFFMAVWCTNTSSSVSFLLMKPHPFLPLNHLTVLPWASLSPAGKVQPIGGLVPCAAARGAGVGACSAAGCGDGDWVLMVTWPAAVAPPRV